ncbi:MAG: class I SAM-dependent methyltransferase [Caulobacteraceae bacterium]
MRREVLQLRRFYATPMGAAAREMIGRKVQEAWGNGCGLDILGLGYATPYLSAFTAASRRAVAAMPQQQGVETWPAEGKNLACLTDEYALPFANALFDRVLLVHALEESDDPAGLLAEVWRVLAPSGRVIVAAADRRGLWSNAETTPFGHGRPYTRSQLELLVREAELEPVAWSRALYAPPAAWAMRWAEGFEQVGSRVWPGFSGVILMEAVKQTFAVKPKGHRVRIPLPRGGLLAPSPVTRDAAKRSG